MVRAGQGVILIVVALLSIGIVMVKSTGIEIGEGGPSTLSGVLLGPQARLALLAVVLMLVVSRLPIRALYERNGLASPIPWMILGTVAILAAVYVPGIGVEKKGAHRWVEFGPVGFQASEVAKWSVPIVLAFLIARRPAALRRLTTGLLPLLTALGLICALIAVEDLGTAVLIAAAGSLVLLAGGGRLRHFLTIAPAGLATIAAFAMTSDYRMRRVQSFLDPLADPDLAGFQAIQSLAAIAGGSGGGRGLGNGLQKFGYLPEDTTDFIFSVICEEIGLLGAAAVLALFLGLLACGMSIVLRTRHPFSRLVGFGVLITIGLQMMINLLVVTGLAPTKGISLPLISSGGTGWCLTAGALGLLLAIEREARISERAVTTAPSDLPPECASASASAALA